MSWRKRVSAAPAEFSLGPGEFGTAPTELGAAPNLVRSGSVLDRGNLAPKSVLQHRSLLRQRSAMDRGNAAPNLGAVSTLRKVGPQPKIGVDLDNEIILYICLLNSRDFQALTWMYSI
jgi:hypothetical protein